MSDGSRHESGKGIEVDPGIGRRRFVRRLGAGLTGGLAGLSLPGFLTACGGSTLPTGGSGTGAIAGRVVTGSGEPASGVGEVLLVRDDGLTLDHRDQVGTDGTWRIGDVPAGEWQVRYWGSGRGHVIHDRTPNPRPVTVRPGETARTRFVVEVAPHHASEMVQIYVGDDFFQEQPLGKPNAPVRVPKGYEVCWYNTSKMDHEVVGGPWDTSGVMEYQDSFIWVADEVGEFPYQCPYHSTEQRSWLIVEEHGRG